MSDIGSVGYHIMMPPDRAPLHDVFFSVISRKPQTDYLTLLVQEFFV